MDMHDTQLGSDSDIQPHEDNVFDDFVQTAVHDIESGVANVADYVHHILDPDVLPQITFPLPSLGPTDPSVVPGAAFAPTSLIGDPYDDMTYWHPQTGSNTCAIDSQEFVIEQLTGQPVSEQELIQVAEAHGWFDPQSDGTAMSDVGNLLAFYGLHVDQAMNATIDDIENQLAQGHGVIVGVRADVLWGQSPDTPMTTAPTIPGQGANHAVEVIGMDLSDPTNPKVILNDSGSNNGCGETVPLELFDNAWSYSDNFLVTAIA